MEIRSKILKHPITNILDIPHASPYIGWITQASPVFTEIRLIALHHKLIIEWGDCP